MAGVVDDEHARNRAASSAMHNILSGDGNQRFKDSKFMEFMAQVKSGDIKFEDNTVISRQEKVSIRTLHHHANW